LVKTNWKFAVKAKDEKRGIDFFLTNLNSPTTKKTPPFVLDANSIQQINHAVVRVEGWHTDKFYPSVISQHQNILDFLSPESLEEAKKIFRTSDFKKILVLSQLPRNKEVCNKSLAILQDKGIDHVLTFETVLIDIMNNIRPHKNYYNDLLQLIRILKQYRLLRQPQLELPYKK